MLTVPISKNLDPPLAIYTDGSPSLLSERDAKLAEQNQQSISCDQYVIDPGRGEAGRGEGGGHGVTPLLWVQPEKNQSNKHICSVSILFTRSSGGSRNVRGRDHRPVEGANNY